MVDIESHIHDDTWIGEMICKKFKKFINLCAKKHRGWVRALPKLLPSYEGAPLVCGSVKFSACLNIATVNGTSRKKLSEADSTKYYELETGKGEQDY